MLLIHRTFVIVSKRITDAWLEKHNNENEYETVKCSDKIIKQPIYVNNEFDLNFSLTPEFEDKQI